MPNDGMRNKQRGRGSARTWQMILITTTGALLCWGATLAMLRAVAQDAGPSTPTNSAQTSPSTSTNSAADTNEAEEVARRTAPPKTSDDELPEYRDSADNNISLPIDI
ncbi:MAG: hypothetical protein RLZZ36_1195 [Pseudomonadota bacterium]